MDNVKKDMEVTPEREKIIEDILIRLYEDQYQCKIVRASAEEEASA